MMGRFGTILLSLEVMVITLSSVAFELKGAVNVQKHSTRTTTTSGRKCDRLFSSHDSLESVSAGLSTQRQLHHDPQSPRRSFLVSGAMAMGILSFQQAAKAVPMVSVDEFGIILRDSPLSVQVVEFSGPKSENVVVKLVDGTTFGIKDIVESSTDPRSPLKVAAACRESGVKTKFVDLEAVLAAAPKKKKLYTNQRVQEAQEKEKERLERIRQDEEARLAQLAKMEQEEALGGGSSSK
mmetsp:Transcript_30571/g.57262  ORF Transcript_30571/g.57262 Transcript_30571/m.57262 type:complete len:238 (-) Transcript_30571:94-807(-)